MTSISRDLQDAPILVICAKREKAVSIVQILKAKNYPTLIAGNIYEGLHMTAQEMPHLIIADVQLPDGHAGHLYDRLQHHATLKNTPMLVHLPQNSREFLESVRGRNFAGVFIGELQKATLLKKIEEILLEPSASPFFFAQENLPIRGQIDLFLRGKILGRTRLHLVAHTDMELNPDAMLSCMRDGQVAQPVLLRSALGIKNGKHWLSLFPIHRSEGEGRKWLSMVPEVVVPGDGSVEVLYCDGNQEIGNELKSVLAGYEVKLETASTLLEAQTALKTGRFNCVLIGAGSQEAFAALLGGDDTVPTFVCAEGMQATGGWGKVLRFPFGLGMILDKLLAARYTAQRLGTALEQVGVNGLPVLLRAKARVLGLDETGGILQLDFPLTVGTKMDLENEFLQKLWDGAKMVMVVSSAKVPGGWQLRFSAIAKGTSKSIYWNRVAKFVATS